MKTSQVGKKTKGIQGNLQVWKVVIGQSFCICRCTGEWERERETNSMYKLWNHVIVESKKEFIWKVIYSGMEIASGRFPTCVSRKPLHR